jgi:hypothetical protein
MGVDVHEVRILRFDNFCEFTLHHTWNFDTLICGPCEYNSCLGWSIHPSEICKLFSFKFKISMSSLNLNLNLKFKILI